MKVPTLVVTALLAVSAQAGDTTIYQKDAYGHTRYDLPHLVVRGDTVYEVDPYGHVRYDRPHYVIKGDKIEKYSPYGHRLPGNSQVRSAK